MIPTITYGKLYEKLRDLGFVQHNIVVDGKPATVFKHRTIDNAMIVFPECPQDEQVEPFHMQKVLAILRSHDLIRERNPLST